MPEPLIDPDCAAGKCGSCVGGPCEHDCHRPVWGEPVAATPDAERRRRALRYGEPAPEPTPPTGRTCDPVLKDSLTADEPTGRTTIMRPGRCSFCGRPAEQHAISRRWWHTAESCKPAYAICGPGEIPAGRLGWQARWPARFEPEPPITFEVELYRGAE